MNKERLLSIIRTSHVSEKSTKCSEKHNQLVFKVRTDAKKSEILQAVKFVYNVSPLSVTTVNVKGKAKRHGKFLGKRKAWKKAYVTLSTGDEIDLGEL